MAKLTEQDILNWNGPEEDYMNNDHLEFFRERLLTMQRVAEQRHRHNQPSTRTRGHPRSRRPGYARRGICAGIAYPRS